MAKPKLSPIRTGLSGRCLRCGEGSLFDGLLKFARRCEACGQDFEIENAGDGPAVFVIFLAGFFIVPLAVTFHMLLAPPLIVSLIIWTPVLIIASIAMLRPLRGLMLNVQISHDAQEGYLDEDWAQETNQDEQA